mmetsp:Transcript_33769/g.51798  ORF Transcript_33769/g.51798 Transcript_33769/m.51798 type:complete len:113 (+) Transcript_33769:949-1287(+)
MDEICSIVEDVGVKDSRDEERLPGTVPGYVVSQSQAQGRPAGTTWVFSDGSQEVTRSSHVKDISDDAKDDFFDEFERQTGGEHFSAQRKAEISEFLDDFENSTSGEDVRRAP